jgi:hypothetical protein
MAEETNKVKKVERIGILLSIFKAWTGKRTGRSIGIEGTSYDKEGKGTKLKTNYFFDTKLPVPATDEEAQELYSCKLADLVEAGVLQLSYDRDTSLGNMIVTALEAKTDFGKLADTSAYATELEKSMRVPSERKPSVVKELKKKVSAVDALLAKYGVTNLEELETAIKKQKKG